MSSEKTLKLDFSAEKYPRSNDFFFKMSNWQFGNEIRAFAAVPAIIKISEDTNEYGLFNVKCIQ